MEDGLDVCEPGCVKFDAALGGQKERFRLDALPPCATTLSHA